jgi:hypothetical protein
MKMVRPGTSPRMGPEGPVLISIGDERACNANKG